MFPELDVVDVEFVEALLEFGDFDVVLGEFRLGLAAAVLLLDQLAREGGGLVVGLVVVGAGLLVLLGDVGLEAGQEP